MNSMHLMGNTSTRWKRVVELCSSVIVLLFSKLMLKREPLSYTSPLGVDTSGFMINLADIRVFHSIIQWLLRIQENSLHLCTISINHGKFK